MTTEIIDQEGEARRRFIRIAVSAAGVALAGCATAGGSRGGLTNLAKARGAMKPRSLPAKT
jgi:hypothetical protein